MFAYVDGKHHVFRIIRLDRYGPGIDDVNIIQSDPYSPRRGPHDVKINVSNKLIPKDYLYTKVDFDELIMYRSQQPRKIIEALFIV